MKTGQSVSKSVLAIVVVGIVLSACLAWFGLHSQEKLTKSAPGQASHESSSPDKPVVSSADASKNPLKVVETEDQHGLPPVIPISLTNVINDSENAFLVRNDSGLQALPHGTQIYGGIEFWLQGMIHLQGLVSRDDEHASFRPQITVSLDETNLTDGQMTVKSRGQNIACVYLIGGTRFGARTGEKFADLIWHYADGTASSNVMKYNIDLRDWWRPYFEDPAQLSNPLTKVAWHGLYPGRNNGSIRLYRVVFINPHREKVIHSLEFVSAMARPSLFVLALTLDPLMPGTRPDNLTSEEGGDPELKGQLKVSVLDTGGYPLPNAEIVADSRSSGYGYVRQKYTTDIYGLALVRYPGTGLNSLDVSAEHEGFSGQKVRWDLTSGDQVPTTCTLKLGEEVKIGGNVVNEDGNPVPDAAVQLYRFWRGGDDDPNKSGKQPSFSSQTQKTDAQGHWEAGGLPPSLMGNIGFGIKHPDYLPVSENVGDNSTTEKELRAGTHKTVLKRGVMVRGRVQDGSGNPVSGAKVWAGRKYYNDRQETSSGADGSFTFNNINVGAVLFSTMANGYAAASKTVQVLTNTPDIVFQLQPGSTLRGHVQDESGLPIADAQISLENNGGMDGPENAFDFSTRTDSNGDFTWDGAPNATMTFYVFHDGFESKRDAKLAPNQNNIITLHRTRTLQGWVLDDTTGQPVTKFTVRTGKASGSGEDVYGVIRYKTFTADDGTFSMDINEEEDDAVLVMADGYADKVEKFPEAKDNTVQVVVRLKTATILSGVVLAPDGSPAPGVTVGAVAGGARGYISLTGGRLRSYDSQSKVATTDEQGRFKLGSVPDDGTVLAAGDPGFARVPLADVKNSGTIILQAWGRIEGTLHIGGQPGVGKDLLFSLNNLNLPGLNTDFNGYKSTTDDQGRFTIEKVPPGEGSIVRLIKTSPNSWSHSDNTIVQVKPGETTQVTLGDNGAVIAGRIRYSFQPTNESPLNLEGFLSSALPMPPTPKFNSPQEAQAFYNSPEWQAAMRLRKNYTVEFKPDGTFTVDGVVPGAYSLNISARNFSSQPWMNPPVAQGSTQVTVPDSFDAAQPIDVGEILINPLPPPDQPQN